MHKNQPIRLNLEIQDPEIYKNVLAFIASLPEDSIKVAKEFRLKIESLTENHSKPEDPEDYIGEYIDVYRGDKIECERVDSSYIL